LAWLHLGPDTLRRITAPTRVLRGDASQPVFARVAKRVAAAIPNAALVGIVASGHAIQSTRLRPSPSRSQG
jgi:pimeloyl-ACP methyl ester carboxylesterase